MKRLVVSLTGATLFAIAVSGFAGAQSDSVSLGDYARKVRATKPPATQAPARVYDNDTIPASNQLNVVGKSEAPASSDSANVKDANSIDAKDAKGNDAKGNDAKGSDAKDVKGDKTKPASAEKAAEDATKIKPGQSIEERQKAYDAWKKRIDDQKRKVDELTSDMNRLQSNPPAAIMTPDLKDKYRQELADKQKALDEAKATLAGMQDDAHKSGVPAAVAE